MGFSATKVEQSLYLFKKDRCTIAIWLHVNDGLVSSNCAIPLESFHQALDFRLNIMWSADFHRIVGIDVTQCSSMLQLSQPNLAEKIVHSYGGSILHNESPLPSNCNLMSEGDKMEVNSTAGISGLPDMRNTP
ncbi:hypothetical protein O181_048771 [Austropuccinia psidii MF-1]|uniref:Uncharacterized protein n=1 Tax=Austropuccinia psidii MF-1 TaxID=1389203 RepID=A0A9Q3DR97_9BASI|nr:hypothetical protein [Austropuccinia psidii MF-1]